MRLKGEDGARSKGFDRFVGCRVDIGVGAECHAIRQKWQRCLGTSRVRLQGAGEPESLQCCERWGQHDDPGIKQWRTSVSMPKMTNAWEVHKFGGASLATPELYRTVGDLLIRESQGRGAVLSLPWPLFRLWEA